MTLLYCEVPVCVVEVFHLLTPWGQQDWFAYWFHLPIWWILELAQDFMATRMTTGFSHVAKSSVHSMDFVFGLDINPNVSCGFSQSQSLLSGQVTFTELLKGLERALLFDWISCSGSPELHSNVLSLITNRTCYFSDHLWWGSMPVAALLPRYDKLFYQLAGSDRRVCFGVEFRRE